jgi:hypothetical protein
MIGGHVTRLAMTAAVVFGLAVGGTVAAQDATPEGGGGLPPLPAGCEVVADGLIGPRDLAISADGTIFVTESGSGGDEVLGPPVVDEEGTPPPQLEEGDVASPAAGGEEEVPEEGLAPPSTRGYTGQVTVVLPDGTQALLSTSFASYSDGVGPAGITIGPDGLVYISVGGAAVLAGIEPLINENAVFVIDPATGEPTPIVELGSYEAANNPDGTDVNPNLYGVGFGPDGLLYVVDAGGNTIYQVNPATGEFTLFAVVPLLSELMGETDVDPAEDRQPVPTSIIVGPDGQFVISLLSEAWPADGPSILSIEADGSFTPIATGLSAVVDLTLGPDGAIYAVQLWSGFGAEGPLPGNVLRINPDGSTEIVVDGLFLPHGLAFDAAGNLFVSTGAIYMGPEAPAGQVLRCAGVVGTDAATPVAAALRSA